jgi:hypothetical protein
MNHAIRMIGGRYGWGTLAGGIVTWGVGVGEWERCDTGKNSAHNLQRTRS